MFIVGFLTLWAPEVKQHENLEVFEVFFPPVPAAGHPAEIAARINLENNIPGGGQAAKGREERTVQHSKNNTESEIMRSLIPGYLPWDRKG